jgi:hypothetical protein
MTTFYEILNNFVKLDEPNFVDHKKDFKSKRFSEFVTGGLSKLNKTDFFQLKDAITVYQKNKLIITPDKEQMKIIKANPNINIRVIAGAGSGKTTTILCRIKYLLDNYITPDQILVLTFNVEACNSLIQKTKEMFGFDIKINIKTIDAFCKYIIYNWSNNSDLISLSELGILAKQILSNKEKRQEICSKYKYVFFDEFQDVNEEQFFVLSSFYSSGSYITVIGDDNQNIYQFRGSDNTFIVNFEQYFRNTQTFQITTNYRSNDKIIDLANTSIKYNDFRIDKDMKTNKKGAVKPKFMLFKNSKDEFNYIIETIKNSGLKWDEIAVLGRTNLYLKRIETMFEQNKIPYVSILTEKGNDERLATIKKENVVLTTLHKSKGLEWKMVFIIGLADIHFPNHLNNNIKNIEEERRLFYVGSTRAKDSLYFCANKTEVPVSRFLLEVFDKLTFINETDSSDIWKTNDSGSEKETYSVTEIIELLNGEDIQNLREKGILNFDIEKTKLFEPNITFSDVVVDLIAEPDFGTFCDYYMTQKMMILNDQNVKDSSTEYILNQNLLNEKELQLFNKYKFYEQDFTEKLSLDIEGKDMERVSKLVKKIKTKKDAYVYPLQFIKKLDKAYEKFKSKDVDLESIYYVSLTRKFVGERRRFLYRNIFDAFKENFINVGERIDKYIDMIKNDHIESKICMDHNYDGVTLCGELDFINKTTKTLVDIKCSTSEFKVEWLIQLLTYLSMLDDKHDIENIAILNIFDGTFYKMKIESFNKGALLDYIDVIIKRDIKNERKIIDVPFLNDQLIDNINTKKMRLTKQKISSINIKDKDKKGFMVLDVENNTANQDIIQISYVLYDNKIIKTIDEYIKDRIVDPVAKKITRISNKDLEIKGKDFVKVMRTFLNDLIKCEFVVGHNIGTDIKKIQYNLEKFCVKYDKTIFDKLSVVDTNNLYRQKYNGKGAGLDVIYKELFKKEIIGQHDSMVDVECTLACYLEMV